MEKKFDTMQMIRTIRNKLFDQIKNMSDEELLKHYEKKAHNAKNTG